MKSIRPLSSFTALTFCLSVSSMASTAAITPVNPAFTAPGIISVSSPASLSLPVTYNIIFKGKTATDGSCALIDSVTASGSNTLCSVPQMTGLPWKLTASSTIAGKVDDVGLKILSSIYGSSTINGFQSNAINTLSAGSQPLTDNYKTNSLNVKLTPAFVANP